MYFDMPNYVSLLGGFLGDETESYQRNWADPCNETILSGDRAGDEDLDYVLNINVEQALVDGFTITGGSIAGVYCENVSPIIQHNRITDNAVGIYCFKSTQPIFKNNWLYKNDYGLYLDSPGDTTIVRNNTIANNNEMGIYLQAGIEPQITNCIFAGHSEDCGLVNCYATYSYIEYPIILDPNTIPPDIGRGNIDGDPNYPPFVNLQAND